VKKTIITLAILATLAVAIYIFYQHSNSEIHFHEDGVPHSH